jgi:hypothetical protein
MTKTKELTAVQVLMRAKKLLVTKGWTKGTFARDKYHKQHLDWYSPKAACFCAGGALNRASGEDNHYADNYLERIIEQTGFVKSSWNYDSVIAVWNDDPKRTKKQVLTAFDKAIALAKLEQKAALNNL